jgi:hypothetical protein
MLLLSFISQFLSFENFLALSVVIATSLFPNRAAVHVDRAVPNFVLRF